MYFYRPRDLVYHRLASDAQLQEVMHNGPRRFLLVTDRLTLGGEQARIAPEAKLVYRTHPVWLTRFNWFHWLDRISAFSLYAVDAEPEAMGRALAHVKPSRREVP
jgi:hypothetical protein